MPGCEVTAGVAAVPASLKGSETGEKAERKRGDGRAGALDSAHEHGVGGARLPDGKLESELSLGHAEPFGAHPNGQFHRVEKKKCEKRSSQTMQNVSKGEKNLDLKTISYTPPHQLRESDGSYYHRCRAAWGN